MSVDLLAREPLRGVSLALANLCIAALLLGMILSMFPLWKSATLSPDSIQRRTYWTGTIAAVTLIFLALLPDLRGALFVSISLGFTLFTLALIRTNHVKIRGRIWAGYPDNRKPDRPPALAPDDP